MDCLICSKKLKTSNLWAFSTVVLCFPGWGRWERPSPQSSSLSPPSSTAAPGWSLSLVSLVFVIGQVGLCHWSGLSLSLVRVVFVIGQVGLHRVHHSHILNIDAIALVVFIVSILLFWFWQSPSISGLPEERPSQGRRRWLCSSRFESKVLAVYCLRVLHYGSYELRSRSIKHCKNSLFVSHAIKPKQFLDPFSTSQKENISHE